MTKLHLRWHRALSGGVITNVASATTLVSAVTAAAPGETVNLTAALTGSVTLTGLAKTNVTLTCSGAGSVQRIVYDNCSGITDSLKHFWDNTDGALFGSWNDTWVIGNKPEVYMARLLNGSAIPFRNASFASTPGDTTALKLKRLGGIYSLGAVPDVQNCTFTNIHDGMICHGSTGVVKSWNNSFDHFYEDCHTGGGTSWSLIGNTATFGQSDYGKRVFGTITGTINVGDLLVSGSGTTAKVLDVVAVGAGYVDGHYNGWRLPQVGVGDNFIGPTGSLGSLTAVTSDFDGIHSDFFQPLLNTNTSSDQTIVVRDNWLYRSTPYDHSTHTPEQPFQGVLAQQNGKSPTGNTNSSTSLTSISSTTGIVVGMTVKGAGIPSRTIVTAISGTTVTLSQAATATATGVALNFAFNWTSVDIQGNVFCAGMPIGITIIGALSGTVAYNSVIPAEYSVGSSRLAISVSGSPQGGTDLACSYNAATNGTGGAIVNSDGGIVETGDVVTTSGFNTIYQTPYTYPPTRTNFAPAPGSVVDTGNAGALTTAGDFRV